MFDDPERYEHDGFYEEDTDYEDEYETDDSDYIVDDEEDENALWDDEEEAADDLPEKKRRKRTNQVVLADNDTDTEETDFYAWKGYDFDILNELDAADYIRQGNHPSRSKSIYITENGIEQAKELLSKYGISDWKQE